MNLTLVKLKKGPFAPNPFIIGLLIISGVLTNCDNISEDGRVRKEEFVRQVISQTGMTTEDVAYIFEHFARAGEDSDRTVLTVRDLIITFLNFDAGTLIYIILGIKQNLLHCKEINRLCCSYCNKEQYARLTPRTRFPLFYVHHSRCSLLLIGCACYCPYGHSCLCFMTCEAEPMADP